MSTEPTKNEKDTNTHMGITFSEVHTQESKNTSGAEHTGLSLQDISEHNKSHKTSAEVFDVTRAFKGEHIETGTFVSDKRRHRVSLGQNLISAFKELWGNTKGKVTTSIGEVSKISVAKKEEPRVIPKAETRAHIVKEAATYSTIAPRSVPRVEVPKTRTFHQDVARLTGSPITVKPPEKKESGWTHTTDASSTPQKTQPHPIPSPDLRASMVAPVVDRRIETSLKDFAPAHQESKPAVPVSVPPKVASVKMSPVQIPPTVPKQDIPLPKSAVSIAPPIQPKAEPVPVFSKPEPALQKPPQPEPVIAHKIEEVPKPAEPIVRNIPPPPPPTPVPPPPPTTPREPIVRQEFQTTFVPPVRIEQKPPRPSIPFQNNHTEAKAAPKKGWRVFIKWAILSGIVVLGVSLGIVLSFYLHIFEGEETTTDVTGTIPSFFEADTKVPVPFENNTEEFLSILKEKIDTAPTGVTQFYPTVPAEGGVRPLSSEELLSLLAVNLPGKTLRALDPNIMIGSITTTKNEPFIIIRSYNFDVLFSGLLVWEGSIYHDLSPLFGTSFVDAVIFADAVQNNKSIRLLRDTAGNEVLLYSFINQNTVVITTSGEALSKLISEF